MTVYIYLVSLLLLWLLFGFFLIFLAGIRKKTIERTLESNYKSVPMEILDINIIPNYSHDGTVTYPLSDKNSSILVRYKYTWNEEVYESRRIFPLEIEWIKPRISPFLLFEDLKAKRLNKCFVDISNPSQAVLFRGWSPYLKQHIIGVFSSGILILFIGIVLWQFL